ncbi:MAG: alpha/beta fold hydrolase [Acidobacteriota bacterium]
MLPRARSRGQLGLALATVVFQGAVTQAATDPGLPGAFIAERIELDVPADGGRTLTADLHYPGDGSGSVDPAAGRCPAVVFGHGFARSRARYVDFGAHLASRGFLVLVPDFSGADHSQNADDLSAGLDWLLAEDARAGSLLFERVDATALGSSGHSAGGLSALVALSRDPRLVTAAPLDPVDSGELGTTALASTTAPVAITHSEDSACNAFGSARDLYEAAIGPKRRVLVVDGNHCDPEMPSDLLCSLPCGGANAERQALYRKLVTGWLEHWLRCDASYAPWVSGVELAADVMAGRVVTESMPDPVEADCVVVPPGEVTGLRVTTSGDDLVLSWDPLVSEPVVESYRVYRSTVPEVVRVTSERVGEVPAPTVELVLPGERTTLASSFFVVRAANAGGEGP